MSAAAGLAIGAGALWLLGQLKKGPAGGAGGGVDPSTSGADPRAIPVAAKDNTAKDIQLATTVTGLGISLASATAGFVTKIVAAGGATVAGGATGVTASGAGGSAIVGGSSGGATTASGGGGVSSATTATVTSITSGFFSAGPIWVAAAIIVAVVATMVAMGLSANAMNKDFYEKQVLGTASPVYHAKMMFERFIAESTKWYYQKGVPVPADVAANLNDFNARTYGAVRVVDFSPAQIRDIGLTCLYLAGTLIQSRNDALVAYYSYMGWRPDQMAAAKFPATPGLNVFQTYTTATLREVLAPVEAMFAGVRPPDVSGNPAFDEVTKPFTVPDLKDAAVRVLGADFWKVVNLMSFIGTYKMIFLAAIEGYGAIGASPQAIFETIASWVGWRAEAASYWVTNFPPGSRTNLYSWWIVDPTSGNRIEVGYTHSDGVLRLSIKGTAIQDIWDGHQITKEYAGYGAHAAVRGRRVALGRFGDTIAQQWAAKPAVAQPQISAAQPQVASSQCIDQTTGTFVNCPPVTAQPYLMPMYTAKAEAVMARQKQKNEAGAALPVVGLGLAALLLLWKGK